MGRFALVIFGLLLGIALGLFQGVLRLLVGTQFHGALPLRHGVGGAVQTVIGPAG